MFSVIVKRTYHIFKAPQDGSSNDAQKEGHDVEDGGRPQQVVEVHHVLAALYVCVRVVAAHQFGSARPVGVREGNSLQSSHKSH